jgi:hypothetical protein
MEYTKVSPNAFETLQLNAGIVVSGFDPDDGSITGSIIGVTSGGVTFNANPTYVDFGDGLDNVPGSTWQLKRITGYDPALSGTFRTVTPSLAKKLSGSGAIDSAKITPSGQLVAADFSDIWLVGDYSAVNKTDDDTGATAGFCAVHLLNAFSASGFQWKSSDEDKGEYAFDFHGHYSMATISLVPFELYVKGYAPVIVTSPHDEAVSPDYSTPTPTFGMAVAIGASAWQWQVSTNNGSTWSNISDGAEYAGTTTDGLYLIAPLTGKNGYKYRAVAFNSFGSATSDAATLELKG